MSMVPPLDCFPADRRGPRSRFGRAAGLYRDSTGRRHDCAMTDGELEAAADRAALAAILEARGRDRQARAVLLEVLATLESVLGCSTTTCSVSWTGWLRSRAAVMTRGAR